MKLLELMLETLWPQSCTLCERPLAGARSLHRECVAEMPTIAAAQGGARRLRDSPPLMAHFADSQDFFRVLHEIKYGGRPQLLCDLADALAERGCREGWLGRQSVLVPVPDDARRCRERGYSVTGRLADRLALLSGARVDALLLGRRSGGVAQAGLDGAAARRRNQEERWVSGALDRYPTEVELLLVEDQITTGATASAALLRLGARGHRVACVALARSSAAPQRLLA